MHARVRATAGALTLALILSACGFNLPAPVEIEGGIFGLDGVAITLTAPEAAVGALAAEPSATFRGTIQANFSLDEKEFPGVLRDLLRIRRLAEQITLDLSLTTATPADLPPAFVASNLRITNVVLKKGDQTIYAGAFTATDAAMTFTRGVCDLVGCPYAAASAPALAGIELEGVFADAVAKEVISGGDFSISAIVTLAVDPVLPGDTVIDATLVSLGAVLE